MKTTMIRAIIFLASTLVAANQLAISQVAVGTPPFNSFGGGPFDTVNLGNLNVHFVIPVFHKAGRGIPFNFDLSYDSSVWSPVTVNGVQYWTPAPNWGWKQTGRVGNITYTYSSQDCQYFVSYTNQWYTAYTQYWYTNWKFIDDAGVVHPLSGSTQGWNGSTQPNTSCDTAPPDVPSTTGTATDGSGYTLSVSNYSNAVVTTPSGIQVNSNGTIKITDTNGNQITSDTSGNYYDTLSSQTPVLTVSGSTYTYTAPGGPAHVTTNYRAYTVRTNFGITSPSLIQEYGPTAINLVDSIALPDGTSFTFTYEATRGTCTPLANTYQPNCVTARIASVTLPTGGTITYTYADGSNGIETDGSTAGLRRTLAGGTWTYDRSGSGSSWTTTISDPVGNQSVLSFFKDTATTANTNSFYESNRQIYQGTTSTGTLLETIQHCYNSGAYPGNSCPNTSVASPLTGINVKTFNADGSLKEYHWANYIYGGLPTYISSGNVGSVNKGVSISYASLGGNILDHPSQVTESGSGISLTMNYSYDEAAYPVQPTSNTPQHGNATTRGNVTTISRTVGSGLAPLTRHFQYYDTGTIYQAWDVNNAYTQYVYGTAAQGNTTVSCGNSFPTQVIYPITELSTSATYSCTGGVATTATDVNGNKTTTNYTDPYYWRPASVVAPYTSNTSTTTTSFSYTATTVDAQMLFNGSNSVVEQLTTYAAFGQPLYSQQHEGPSSGNWDTTQTNYDSMLRPFQSTMACVATAGSGCPSAAVTMKTFDALGRVKQVTNGGTPAGSVSYTYTLNDVLQVVAPAPSGETNKQKQLEYDPLGRLTSVCEITNLAGSRSCGQASGSYNGYVTTYAYSLNASNYPTVTVTQGPAGSTQTRVYTYDLVGRLISEQNPETNNKTLTYVYDSDPSGVCSGTYMGDLVRRTDAKGNNICYQYDVMHRNTQISYPSGPDSANTMVKTFVYDAATFNGTPMTNPKGRLVEAYVGSSGSKITDEFFQYSARGELTDTWECTPHSGTNGCGSVSNYYHVTAGFWENGALKSLSSNISGVPAQNYGLDSMGRTYSVSNNSTQNPNLVTSTSYNLSPVTYSGVSSYTSSVSFGSGDSDMFYVDATTGRQWKYVFNVNGATNSGQTTWNPNGSLASLNIADNIPGTTDTQNCNFGHDDVSRIASVSCVNGSTNVWNQQFNYDAFGNAAKTSSGPGLSFPGSLATQAYSPLTNWLMSMPGCTPTYDNNGQATYDCAHSYTWDSEGKLYSVDTSTTLTHDALGRMVEKAVGSTYTQIVYGPQGRFATMNGQTLAKAFIPLPEGATAVYTSAGLAYYRHADHLGSSRLATTAGKVATSGSGSVTVGGSEHSVPSGTSGTGSVTMGGSEQSWQNQTAAATSASGTITISGSEGYYSYTYVCGRYGQTCTTPIPDAGNVSATVNGVTETVSYGNSSTSSSVAGALANAFNSDGNSPVTASASGSTVTIIAKATGAGTNYSLSATSWTTNTTYFSYPSFYAGTSGPNLTGGQDAQYQTLYDSGTTTITVNGHATAYNWSGSSTTTSTIAQGLAQAINSDGGAAVNASASGATVNLTARTIGSNTNYSLSTSTSSQRGSFSSSASGANLTGGTGFTAYDTGTVWVTVNGSQASVSYGQSDTSSTIAANLATAINGSSLPVTASASGATVNMTAKQSGAGSNYSLTAGSSSSQSGTFSPPSFSATASGANLTGGGNNVATALYSATAYAPYGEPYAQSGNTDLSFTGQETDTTPATANGTTPAMYDFLLRKYSPTQSRWLSPDPAGLGAVDMTNPQSWNRYAYALNNPMALIDPLGDEAYEGCSAATPWCYSSGTNLALLGGWADPFAVMTIPVRIGSLVAAEGTTFISPENKETYTVGPGNMWYGPNGEVLDSVSSLHELRLPDLTPVPLYASIGITLDIPDSGNRVVAATTKPTPNAQAKKAGCGRAVVQGLISVGLDAVGAIPLFGNMVSATAAGAKLVNDVVAYGGAAYGIGTGLNDESPVGAISASAGLGLALADAALEGGKVIPVLGNMLSGVTGLYDLYKLGETIYNCPINPEPMISLSAR